MKLKKSLFLIIPVITLVLEALPYGAVLIFGGMEETWRKTFSYFSLTPFGYANFGPFITALLTCVLFILALVAVFKKSRGLNIAVMVISIVAAAVSLTPLLFGFDYFTPVAVAISALLFAEFCVSLIKPKFTVSD